MLIQNTPHETTLEEVIRKAELYIRTSNTDQLLTSGINSQSEAVNKMSSEYKKSTQSRKQEKHSASVESNDNKRWKRCQKCYVEHSRNSCPWKESICHRCGKKGHLKSVCKSKNHFPVQAQTTKLELFSIVQTSRAQKMKIFNLYQRVGKQIWLKVCINGKQVSCQWDTGSTCSMVNLNEYKMLGSPPCQPLTKDLIAYGGRPLKVKGKCLVNVKLGDKRQNMPLIVVNELGSNLFGLDWSDAFGLTEEGISAVKSVDIDLTPSSNSLQEEVNVLNCKQFSELKGKFNDVFSGKLGKCKQLKANMHLKPEARPVFHKPRPLPFAIKQKVKDVLDSLETGGVLKRVNFSPWAAPIVVVNKPNGSIRICGDFKGLNQNIDVDQHPIPTLDSLLEKL